MSVAICDLVMKGCVTSGVVYPLAFASWRKQTDQKLGGTSAGARAAAAAAE